MFALAMLCCPHVGLTGTHGSSHNCPLHMQRTQSKVQADLARTQRISLSRHRVALVVSVCLQEAFKAREAVLMAKSEEAWKQYQDQRGEWSTTALCTAHVPAGFMAVLASYL